MMQNEKLALAISEVGWYEFKTMLEYKFNGTEKIFCTLDALFHHPSWYFYCGNIFKELSLKVRSWACQFCSTPHERDVNAAKYIKSLGLRNKPSIVNLSH